MKTITVKRSKWARGGKNGDARLLNHDECMCCLGFAICQISKHVSKLKMLDRLMPDDVFKGESFLTKMNRDAFDEKVIVNNDLAGEAAKINDHESISGHVREQKLKKLFKKHGFKIVFVD